MMRFKLVVLGNSSREGKSPLTISRSLQSNSVAIKAGKRWGPSVCSFIVVNEVFADTDLGDSQSWARVTQESKLGKPCRLLG